MPRKRKVPVADSDETNDDVSVHNLTMQHGTMYSIMSNVQMNETFHKKYIKEMQQLYAKMDHGAFLFTFLKMIKSAMEAEESNEYAYTSLLFCAKYISSYQCEETHILVKDVFKWLTSTISSSPHIRYRLCQFVNLVLNALGVEAALDDCICDSIMSYMINRLRDMSPNVRVQAILALQRLQVPDNPDDIILKTYQFHLSADPSTKVRQAVITSMGRNQKTIPYILERLWDIDEKVRRHTYLNMSSYPVKAYKVSQRLTFLEQGLNDRSDMVRKVVTSVMLPQWLESYNKNYISFITALKLDANEEEMDRFRKITKVALKEAFKSGNITDLIECLPLENDIESELNKCIPFETLTIEESLYWICLIEYLQSEMADELDLIIPDLSTFCSYILKFCQSQKNTNDDDKWKKMEYQYILLTLIEIAYTYDLGDEIGRENLKQLIGNLFKNYEIESQTVQMIVKCTENLIIQQDDRLQFFVDIIKDITDLTTFKPNDFINDRSLIDELLEKYPDKQLKLSSLKVKILDLEEQERNYVKNKDYVKAQEKADEKATCNEEYKNLLKPLLAQSSSTSNEAEQRNLSIALQYPKKITVEDIIKCLQISFYMVVSKKIHSLTPNVCELYKDFIRRHIESTHITIRNWALKCGTAYSMLYDQLAKDVYSELYAQFFKNQNTNIWNTSIDCIFELLDRYGFEQFENADKQNKNKKPGRQLYTIGLLDEQDEDESPKGSGVDVVFMMSHILDTCDNVSIISAIIRGLCRLVLHGHIKKDDIIEKLLLKYFNPATESEVNQLLGVFFENLIQKKKQEYLQACLLPTVITILSAPYDSPLHEIKPETILKFVIDSTRPQFCSTGLNIHNTIALSFMQEMQNNISNKELAKILSKELITLEIAVTDDLPLRNDLKNCCDSILEHELDPKTVTNILNFKMILNGDYRHITQRPSNPSAIIVEETLDDLSENEENETNNQQINKNNVNEKNYSNIEEGVQEKNKGTDNSDITVQSVDTNDLEPELEQLKNSKKNTPTTFGEDNATNVRHLRKSLNARTTNSLGGPTRPPKARYDTQNVEKTGSELNINTVSATVANITLQENATDTEENESVLTHNITDKSAELILNETNLSEGVQLNETTESEVIPATPSPGLLRSAIDKNQTTESEAIPATPSPGLLRSAIGKRSRRIAASQLSKRLPSNDELSAKRTLSLTPATKSTTNKTHSSSPKKTQSAKVIENDVVDLNSSKNKKNKESTNKTNTSTIPKSPGNYKTRNTSKLEYQFNSIITRKRAQVNKVPLNTEASLPSPRQTTTNRNTRRCVVELRSNVFKKPDKLSKIPVSSRTTRTKVTKNSDST